MRQNNIIKISTRVDADIYAPIKDHFHHGQQTQFFRQVCGSLAQIIKTNKAEEIVDYLYNNKPLTLPAIKEEDQDEL